MRVVLINQYYYPDLAPTGRYLHELARALVAAGHDTTVIASQRAYGGGGDYPERERLDGVEVVRLPGFGYGRATHLGKLTDYAAYYAQVAGQLARTPHPELVVALTTPPFLGLLAKLVAHVRGSRHAHWIMDVYPDVMQAHGMVDGFAYRALQELARISLRGARLVVTLGPAMAERMRNYTGGDTRVAWVPLWAPTGLSPWQQPARPPLRLERGWEPERLVLLYSGNMGLGHRFDEFLAAAERLGPRGPRWAFAGSGRGRTQIEAFVGAHRHLPVELLSYVPEEKLREHLCSADVHLVSLDARWEGTLLPSKLQASFALGKPVIFVGAASQDMARWVRESGGGWFVAEGDLDGLLTAIEQATDPVERERRGAAALAYRQRELDGRVNIERLVELLTAAGT
jgi:glycosyltransferase involved in cell wall biosynthesis